MKSRRLLPAAFAALLAMPVVVRADSGVPPGTPPDIAKIIVKGQKGQRLTMDEIMKLQKWGMAVAGKMNTPAANPSQFKPPATAAASSNEGVPCQIRYEITYKNSDPSGGQVQAQANVSTKCMMYPQIGGTSDYFGSAFNPAASPSSFRFEPLMSHGAAEKSGTGNFQRFERSKDGSVEARGSLKSTIATFMLVTSGHGDALYPWSGGAGGFAEGMATSHDKDGSRTYKISDAMLLDALGMFAAETNAKPTAEPGKPCPVPVMTFRWRR